MISNIIQNSALKKMNEILEILSSSGIKTGNIELKPYNYEIDSFINKNKYKVQVYFGKKGLKVVIQGNQLSPDYHKLNNLVNNKFTLDFKEEPEKTYAQYIGTDESGKGDFFGPLVIAGFFVNENIQNYLAEIGVRDSKELSDTKIDELASLIKSKYPKNYSVISIKPEKYNQLYEEFSNLNKLLNWGHSKVIEEIYQNFKTETVIVDQFSKAQLNISLNSKFANVNFIQIPKAEKYYGVAAASILARNELNNWFNKKKSDGYKVLKGASSEVEITAKNIYKTYGKEILLKLVKQHFKTTQKIFES